MHGLPLICSIPEVYEKKIKDSLLEIGREEDAVIWLWAQPSLFPWDSQVEWLFSPVNGNTEWRVGDLWGVDENGELFYIENKRITKKKASNPDDPFSDFYNYTAATGEKDADELLRHWKERYNKKIKASAGKISIPNGVLPNSSNCKSLESWSNLKQQIVERIHSKQYRETVGSFIERRQAADNPPPHYCGLYVPEGHIPGPTSKKVLDSMTRLKREKGSDHVHLFVALAAVKSREVWISIKQQHADSAELSFSAAAKS